VSGVHDEEKGTLTFFLVNRHGTDSISVDLSLQGFATGQVIDHQVMTHNNLEAVNIARNQDEVAPRKGTGAQINNATLSLSLSPYSYQMVRIKV
jgi:alpha-N-arabinofuranosidase